MYRCKGLSPPRVTGSLSENAVKNGFSHFPNCSNAFLLASCSGSSVLIGTKEGNIRAPALYVSSGKGAS
ncbi:hypothetical protein ES705_33784 [subsurface metagenome]